MMRKAWCLSSLVWHPTALALAAAFGLGCGISDAARDLFASEGEGGAAGVTSSSSSGSATSGAGGATGTGGSGGAGGDATPTSSSSTTTSSSSGGAQPTLDCGDTTCPQGEDSACCWDGVLLRDNGFCVDGPPSDETCNTQIAQDGLRTRVACQLPEHCGSGQVCCGDREAAAGTLFYTDVSCRSTCNWPDIWLCDPMNPVCPVVDTPQQGKVQTVCTASQRLPGNYFVCAMP